MSIMKKQIRKVRRELRKPIRKQVRKEVRKEVKRQLPKEVVVAMAEELDDLIAARELIGSTEFHQLRELGEEIIAKLQPTVVLTDATDVHQQRMYELALELVAEQKRLNELLSRARADQ